MLSADDIVKLFRQPQGPQQTPGAVFISGALEPQVIQELVARNVTPIEQDGGFFLVYRDPLEPAPSDGDVIYKYPLGFGTRRICFPGSATLVHVGMQDGAVYLWARIGKGEAQTRFFQIMGTGQPFPETARHVGTTQDGSYVWHVLERLDVLGVEVRDSSSTG